MAERSSQHGARSWLSGLSSIHVLELQPDGRIRERLQPKCWSAKLSVGHGECLPTCPPKDRAASVSPTGATACRYPIRVRRAWPLSTLGLSPVNGLRHPVTPGTTGCYIWCGEEFSDAPDFFRRFVWSICSKAYPRWHLFGAASRLSVPSPRNAPGYLV